MPEHKGLQIFLSGVRNSVQTPLDGATSNPPEGPPSWIGVTASEYRIWTDADWHYPAQHDEGPHTTSILD